MSAPVIVRLPSQAARDRSAMADYLRDLASKLDRMECDPYGVMVVFIGPEREDIGSRGIRYLHDYRRARRAVMRAVDGMIMGGPFG